MHPHPDANPFRAVTADCMSSLETGQSARETCIYHSNWCTQLRSLNTLISSRCTAAMPQELPSRVLPVCASKSLHDRTPSQLINDFPDFSFIGKFAVVKENKALATVWHVHPLTRDSSGPIFSLKDAHVSRRANSRVVDLYLRREFSGHEQQFPFMYGVMQVCIAINSKVCLRIHRSQMLAQESTLPDSQALRFAARHNGALMSDICFSPSSSPMEWSILRLMKCMMQGEEPEFRIVTDEQQFDTLLRTVDMKASSVKTCFNRGAKSIRVLYEEAKRIGAVCDGDSDELDLDMVNSWDEACHTEEKSPTSVDYSASAIASTASPTRKQRTIRRRCTTLTKITE